VAEWFKAAVLKTARGASPSWVRIPPLPLYRIDITGVFVNVILGDARFACGKTPELPPDCHPTIPSCSGSPFFAPFDPGLGPSNFPLRSVGAETDEPPTNSDLEYPALCARLSRPGQHL
jgi:hypothetical protein